jgi:hypothetical protein
MVRFSDMLGGSGDADEPSGKAAARDLAPDVEEQPDPDEPPAKTTVQFVDQVGVTPPVPPPADPPAAAPDRQSPKDVLDRLTNYASSARAPAPDPPAADPVPPPPSAAPPKPDDEPAAAPRPAADAKDPASDDLLPRARRTLRKPGRGDKRRP